MDARISVLKFLRYRLIQHRGQVYLLDQESSPLVLLFPFLMWTNFLKGYKINQDDLTRLQHLKRQRVKNSGLTILLVGISFSLSRVIPTPSLQLPFLSGTIAQVLTVIIFILLIALFHQNRQKRTLETVEKTITLKNLPVYYIRIRPSKIQHLFFPFLVWFVYLGLTILSVGLYITENLAVGLIATIVFLFLSSISFVIFTRPGLTYKCTYYK